MPPEINDVREDDQPAGGPDTAASTGGEPTTTATPAATPPAALSREELDEHLARRDQALMQSVQGSMMQFAREIMQNTGRGAEPQPTTEEAQQQVQQVQQDLNISPEEFWRNPQAALDKFYQTKVAPALKKPAAPTQSGPDHGLQALVETRIQTLWNKLSEDERKTYGPYLHEVIKSTDMRILADPKGMDSVWRLTKSHADEHIAQQQYVRSQRNQNANLPGGSGRPNEPIKKVELDAEQSAVAAGMGISPEEYVKYATPEEVMPGQRRNQRK